MWLLHYYLCGLLEIGDPREDRLRSGDGIRVSVVTYFCRGNPALCWQRSNRNVRLFLGSSIPGTYPSWERKFLSLTICWKSKLQYELCTVLVVEPAIYVRWSPLFRW